MKIKILKVLILCFFIINFDLYSNFIENKGQWNEQIQFLFQSENLNAWVMSDGIVFDHFQFTLHNNKLRQEGYVLFLKFENSSGSPGIETLSRNNEYFNFFKGRDKTKWVSGVNSFGEVKFKNVYKGIDILFYSEEKQLRYDFIVKPSGNPDLIRLSFEGINNIDIGDNSELIFKTPLGIIEHNDIKAW